MKKISTSLALLFSTISLFAQWNYNGNHIYNINTANVGIGVGTLYTPQYKLHIYDGGSSGLTGLGFQPGTSASDNTYIMGVKTSNGTNGLIIKTRNTDSYHGQSAIYVGYGNGPNLGSISLMSNVLDFRTGVAYTDDITGRSFGTSALYITNYQSVGIGTMDPGPYKLAVEGSIGARSIKVTLASPWADYVFGNAYKLRPISDLEHFIQTNNHLPGIPSAEEVKRDGLDLAQTNIKLLEKIEELTLYVIELNKKVEQLEKRKTNLKKRH